jgi:hypothetical protein
MTVNTTNDSNKYKQNKYSTSIDRVPKWHKLNARTTSGYEGGEKKKKKKAKREKN